MYCRYCGKEIPENTIFCPNCGKKQNDDRPYGKTSLFQFYLKHKKGFVAYALWCLIHIGLLVFSPPGEEYEVFRGLGYIGLNLSQKQAIYDYHKKIDEFYPFDTSLSNILQGGEFWCDPIENIKAYDSSELFFYTILLPVLIWTFVKIWPCILQLFRKCYHHVRKIALLTKKHSQKSTRTTPSDIYTDNDTTKTKRSSTIKWSTIIKAFVALICLVILGVRKYIEHSHEQKETIVEKIDIETPDNKMSMISTGETPYSKIYGANMKCSKTECSGIKVTAPETSDVVVIVKKNNEHGKVAGHVYISAGDTYKIDLPDGTYQAFFYYGDEWSPYKDMGNGVKGGFVRDEVFAKDDPQDIYSAVLSYVLQLRRDGNFHAESSNRSEVF